MMPEQDLMAMMRGAFEEARDEVVDVVRWGRASIVQGPAVGRKLTAQQRRERYRAWRASPDLQAASFDELSARFELPPEKPIPRRLVDYARLGEREANDAETNKP